MEGSQNEVQTAARSRACQAHRAGSENNRRYDHSRNGQGKPQEGEIVAAGPGARKDDGALQPLDVKAGDRVLFGKWSGSEVKVDGEELLIMKESDLLGIIESA